MHELQLITGDATDDTELSWQERSLCAQTDPEAFFPEKADPPARRRRSVSGVTSAGVPRVRLAHDERFGIWGGLSERERRKLKKRAV